MSHTPEIRIKKTAGFSISNDGIVTLSPYNAEVRRGDEWGFAGFEMSPEFVKEMAKAVRDWEIEKSRSEWERWDRSQGKLSRWGRMKTNIDPDGIERGWSVGSIEEDEV